MLVEKRAARAAAIYDVLIIIENSEEGATIQQIMEMSGFSLKETRSIVNQLKRQGKIKSVSTGAYILDLSRILPPALLLSHVAKKKWTLS